MARWNNKPPKLGVVASSIEVFSEEGKQAAEGQMRSLFERLQKQGSISKDSIFYPDRIFHPHQAQKVADAFAEARVDGVVVLNSAFPAGNTFLTLALNPYLRNLPLVVVSTPEYDSPGKEWSINSYCGLIMNNFAAKRAGRRIFTIGGWPEPQAFCDEFKRHVSVIGAVKELRHDFLGRFGDAPSGFHSANVDLLACASLLGTRVETVDLLAVMEIYKTGSAAGYLGETSFSDKDVEQTCEQMTSGREVLVDRELVLRAARLYHALKAIIEANGFTSVAVRCWPELMAVQPQISPCLSICWLLEQGVVRSASCESDVGSCIWQSIGALLSGRPAACLDFVNDIGAAKVVQLGHCGFGIPCQMASCAIGWHGPNTVAGHPLGPACIGQYEYGPKTGISIIQDGGGFKMLAFTGESRPDTAQGLQCAASDIEVGDAVRLNRLIIEQGFPHHLALAMGDISEELKLFCGFYGIEYFNPADS